MFSGPDIAVTCTIKMADNFRSHVVRLASFTGKPEELRALIK